MRELALFAGAGGGLLGSKLNRWRTVCAVEIDPYCREVLLARQRDGMLDRFPVWDDIRTFDGVPWRGSVDVVSGGFPCQDISAAGARRGLSGARSGLFFEMLRIVEEVRPRYVFAENSPHLRTRGLGTIVREFALLGYDSRWCVLGGHHVGAPHKRDRMWVVASDANYDRERVQPIDAEVAGASQIDRSAGKRDAADANLERQRVPEGRGVREGRRSVGGQSAPIDRRYGWWVPHIDPGVDDGMADRMVRSRATGNGQIPGVAALAWEVMR